jgi:hypothetical protein
MFKKSSLNLLVLAIFLLHQDCWNWKSIEPLVFGFLPVGLAYHAAYSVFVAIMMALLVKYAWPPELDAMETDKQNETKPASAHDQ